MSVYDQVPHNDTPQGAVSRHVMSCHVTSRHVMLGPQVLTKVRLCAGVRGIVGHLKNFFAEHSDFELDTSKLGV